MADDKTTKTPEQPVTDSGPGKETPPAPPKEPEKVSVSPEPEKKTEPEVKTPQVSVYSTTFSMSGMRLKQVRKSVRCGRTRQQTASVSVPPSHLDMSETHRTKRNGW